MKHSDILFVTSYLQLCTMPEYVIYILYISTTIVSVLKERCKVTNGQKYATSIVYLDIWSSTYREKIMF